MSALCSQGFLLLENVVTSQSFGMADKTAVLSAAHMKAALTALAHFHGAWWRFLNGGNPVQGCHFSIDDVNRTFLEKRPVSAMSGMVRSALK